MRNPELSYFFDDDQRVYREASLILGGFSVAVQAITVSGRSDRGNQDAFGFWVGDRQLYSIVLDGAVSRDASHIARDLFEETQEVHTASEMLSSINRRLGQFALAGGASTGTIVQMTSEGTIDIAHVTDSWAMVLFRDGSTRLLTTDQHESFDAKALSIMAQVAVEQGCDMATARRDPRVSEALAAMFEAVRNTPDGTGEGILNGNPYMDQYIQRLQQPLSIADVTMILLGSDGARFPYRSEKDPAYRDELFSLVALHGVERVTDMIHQEEVAKPPTPTYPRWSPHDDKTLVALSPSFVGSVELR